MTTMLSSPTATAAATASPARDALHERHRLADEAVGIGREAEQLRQLADEDRQGEAVHVADLGRLGQQVGDEPELGPRAERA